VEAKQQLEIKLRDLWQWVEAKNEAWRQQLWETEESVDSLIKRLQGKTIFWHVFCTCFSFAKISEQHVTSPCLKFL